MSREDSNLHQHLKSDEHNDEHKVAYVVIFVLLGLQDVGRVAQSV